ncbi:Plasmodium exported protein, unknown function [Plasmodium ovale]|uniref:Pv-fam-d protein n=2 Tax=Plasmodium ovale TaxID=36330 RepID=A0A1C3KJS0_PLAOA|nr:Plasmodium exported protein, unknown function [Plasmodium ovale]
MAENKIQLSFCCKIFTTLLILSSTYGTSMNQKNNQMNGLNVRTSRLLRGETDVDIAASPKYSFLKEKIINIVEEDDDTFGKRLNDSAYDDVFRKRFNHFINADDEIENEYDTSRKYNKFDKPSNSYEHYNNSGMSYDSFKNFDNFKKGADQLKFNNNIENFFNGRTKYGATPSKQYLGLKSINNSYQKSNSLVKKNENIEGCYNTKQLEALRTMIKNGEIKQHKEKGVLGFLKNFDKKFETELFRATKCRTDNDHECCKFKNNEDKISFLVNKYKIYIPPALNATLLIIVMTFATVPSTIFNILVIIFFGMMSYYGYKLYKVFKARKFFKRFNRQTTFKRRIHF